MKRYTLFIHTHLTAALMLSYLENDFIIYEIRKGILYAVFKEKKTVDLKAAKQIISTRLEVTGEKEYPILIDGRSVKALSFTKEARDFLSSGEGRKGVKATAMLVSGPVSRTIANFFLYVTVKKPFVPTRIFSNQNKALNWLQQFK